MKYFLPAIFAFALTIILTLVALKVFPKAGLMDRPEKYGLKRKPIPYYGGALIVIAFLISVLIFVPMDRHVLGLLFGALLIAGISFADDFFTLKPWIRLIVQILAALVLVGAGIGIHSINNPLGPEISLDKIFVYSIPLLSALFTVVWVVTIVNTMNFLDGLNGLSSGVSAIAAFTLFLLSIRAGIHYDVSSQIPVAMISVILFACALAFCFFEFYPAKILMGDTGSMFLGFIIAALAIFSGGKVATAFLVLGFPILDAAWVILRRILSGKSPMKGDKKHLHHRLLEVGLSEKKSLVLIYVLSTLFGLIAVYVQGIYKFYAIIALGILMLILGLIVIHFSKKRI